MKLFQSYSYDKWKCWILFFICIQTKFKGFILGPFSHYVCWNPLIFRPTNHLNSTQIKPNQPANQSANQPTQPNSIQTKPTYPHGIISCRKTNHGCLSLLSIFFSRFIKGFITRNQPSCTDNSEYLAYVRHNYLTRLTENLPKTVLEKDTWLTPPPILQEVCHTFVQELFHGRMQWNHALPIMVNCSACLKFLSRLPSFWRSSTFATWRESTSEESRHRGKRRYSCEQGQQSTPELKFILEIDVLKNLF